MSSPYSLDEAYHKALEIERLNGLYRVDPSKPSSMTPSHSTSTMIEFSVGTLIPRVLILQLLLHQLLVLELLLVPPRTHHPMPALSASVSISSSPNSSSNVQCFS